MATINPYLTFLGNCEEAFDHYKSIFGREFDYVGRFSEMPEDPKYPLSEEDKQKIMHISLPISKETRLMGSDTGGEWAGKTIVGNNISISITAQTKVEADFLFRSLSEGGNITMPIEDTFWGDYFGMCTDKFNINWMVSFNAGSN
ncbi:VOC family protein [uncultured Kriegella sp.]|uniref:VOC family protein n=1 Tax=uncultured Kriegella sp. TaxID=1798910 RepID=UPI0030DC82D9|tara:strand:+ start:53008 stop:53442 length:435 start_codon:yes stop_codon:yes gene_type:complete